MVADKKYPKKIKGRRILKVRGIARMVGDVDKAIKALRESRSWRTVLSDLATGQV